MNSIVFVFLVAITVGLAANSGKEYPCSELTNQCVGEWFAEKYGGIALESAASSLSNFSPAELNLHTPAFNLSLHRSDWTIAGLDQGVINNFYIENDKTVLTLFWDEISCSGNEIFTLHKQGELDVEVTTPFVRYFHNVYATRIIDSEEVTTTNVHLKSMSFSIDDSPALAEAAAENEDVNKCVEHIAANLPTLAVEEGYFMGPVVADAFIENAICSPSEVADADHDDDSSNSNDDSDEDDSDEDSDSDDDSDSDED